MCSCLAFLANPSAHSSVAFKIVSRLEGAQLEVLEGPCQTRCWQVSVRKVKVLILNNLKINAQPVCLHEGFVSIFSKQSHRNEIRTVGVNLTLHGCDKLLLLRRVECVDDLIGRLLLFPPL